ncbi:MAG: hypothetical protein KC414_08680, partial [Romboutsia sp.]|nr:hypothetical protein [Romboutsia sp.]
DVNYGALKNIREIALQRVLDNNFIENEVIDLAMSIPVSKVYYGHPNLNITKVGNKIFVENMEFSTKALEKVRDIGYVLHGKLYTKNNSKGLKSYPFLTKIMRSKKRYKDRKVPVIAFDFNGETILYPVALKSIDIDVSARIDEIVNNETSLQNRILTLNNLLIQYGIDVNKNGFTFDNMSVEHIENVKELLKQSKDYPEVSDWLTDNRSINDILSQEALINIDIANDPFHSPKIKTKITKANGLKSDTLIDVQIIEEIPENEIEVELENTDRVKEVNLVEQFAKDNNDGVLDKSTDIFNGREVRIYQTNQNNGWSGVGSSFVKTWDALKLNQGEYFAHVRILLDSQDKFYYSMNKKSKFAQDLRDFVKKHRNKDTVVLIDLRELNSRTTTLNKEIKKIKEEPC